MHLEPMPRVTIIVIVDFFHFPVVVHKCYVDREIFGPNRSSAVVGIDRVHQTAQDGEYNHREHLQPDLIRPEASEDDTERPHLPRVAGRVPRYLRGHTGRFHRGGHLHEDSNPAQQEVP